MGFGVYIHFPWCRQRCGYCDFAIHVRRTIPHEAYAEAVLRELRSRAAGFAGRPLDSIYFGGGTPSLWEPSSVGRVIAGVREAFPAGGVVEITLEANPDDLPPPRLGALRAAGISRLSIGAQTFDTKLLPVLGRLHGPDDTLRAVEAARAEGFDEVSVDLMFGLPSVAGAEVAGPAMAGLDRDLDALLSLDAEHLSIYQLTVEERTPFGAYARRGELDVPSDEGLAAMFERVEERTAAAGYTRYEVSSYARPGHAAVHNNLYWSGGEWLGLGSSAHSYVHAGAGGERRANVKNVDAYLRALGSEVVDEAALIAAREPLGADDLAREAMWLGLRRIERGVSRTEYSVRHGVDPARRFGVEIARLQAAGLIELTDEAVRLTRRGRLLADAVGAEFL